MKFEIQNENGRRVRLYSFGIAYQDIAVKCDATLCNPHLLPTLPYTTLISKFIALKLVPPLRRTVLCRKSLHVKAVVSNKRLREIPCDYEKIISNVTHLRSTYDSNSSIKDVQVRGAIKYVFVSCITLKRNNV